MKKNYLIILLTQLLTHHLPAQQTWHVNTNVNGNSTGLDWPNAFNSLQDALVSAASGDEIWVAEGTYLPTAGTDRFINFELKNGVKLLGGFAGNETVVTARDWMANPTILSGNIGNPASAADNSMTVVVGYNLDSTTVLDGFIVERGYSEENYGAGLAMASTAGLLQMKVNNCRFRNNYAYSGGAVYVGSFGAGNYALPQFSNCIFERNHAFELGGAFLREGPTPANDTFLMQNCHFLDNAVRDGQNGALTFGQGGAIYFGATENANIRLKGCIFERDSCTNGGAIGSCPSVPGNYQVTLVLDSCTFTQNWAFTGGGLEYIDVAGVGNTLNLLMHNCYFEGNLSTNNAGSVFSIYLEHEPVVNIDIQNSSFITNNPGALGGAMKTEIKENGVLQMKVNACKFTNSPGYPIGNRLGIGSRYNKADVYITNSLFAENGAGIASNSLSENNYFNTVVRNCTFFRNSNFVTFYKVVYPSYQFSTDTFNNRMLVENCIIWDPEYDPLSVFVNHNPTEPIYFPTGYGYTFRNCVVPFSAFDAMNTQGGSFTENNFYKIYPEFEDTLSGNYRLSVCAPIINKGTNAGVLEQGLLTDLDGLPRIMGDTVDIGAYEQQYVCISDITASPSSKLQVSISPNPSPDGTLVIYISDGHNQQGEITVHDSQGRIVFTKTENLQANEVIPLQHLPPGLYFVSLQSADIRWSSKWLKVE